MGLNATARRRWLGGLALAGALGMLIAGETVLEGRLRGLAALGYWLVCFLLTGVAMAVALWDLRAVRQQTRRQERELLESALKEIEVDVRAKSSSGRREGAKGQQAEP
jgi:hypothetical protein